MNAGLLFFLFAVLPAHAGEVGDSDPSSDSTALVREAPVSATPALKPKPVSRRSTVDPEVAVPSAGSGVAVRRQAPAKANADRDLPRLSVSTLDAGISAISATPGEKTAEPGIPGVPHSTPSANSGPASDDQIAAANQHIAAAEDNLRRHFPDFSAAERDLQEAIALVPRHPKAYTLLAALYNSKGDYAKAEENAMVSLRFYSKNAVALENLALAQLLQGRASEAERSAASAAEIDPQRATSRYVYALVLDAEHRRADALKELQAAAALEPGRFGPRFDAAAKGARIFGGAGANSSFLFGGAPGEGSRRSLPWSVVGGVIAVLFAGFVGMRWWSKPRSASPTGGWRRTTTAAEPEGLLAGRYEMTKVLGHGGQGDVYEAVDRSLQRPVAIKKMSEELTAMDADQGRAHLLREARTVASLHHPAIVDLYEIVERGFDVYLVFELVRGKTLEKILAERGRLSLAHAVEILRPVCQALGFAHGRGVAHRDLKPGNIMITEQGHVKIMDFGIARSVAQMGPEEDVFALGSCLYEILCGSAPYPPGASPADKMAKKFPALGSRIPDVPDAVEALIAESLEPRVDHRIKTPAQFLSRLEMLGAAAAPRPPASPR